MPQVEVKNRSTVDYQQQIKAGKHTFVSDAPASAGGAEAAPNPHELLLGALGACTAITMQMYAKRKGWDLKEVTVKVSEDKVDSAKGGQISKLVRDIQVAGNLEADQIEALKTVAEKCPIHKLLAAGNEITTVINHN